MDTIKKYLKWSLGIVFVLCYLYFFILNNFHKDLLNLKHRLAYKHRSRKADPGSEAKKEHSLAVPDEEVYLFPHLEMKEAPTVLMKKPSTTWHTYHQGGLNCVAVYLTDTNCCWPGIVHAFRSFGIPVSLYTSLEEALKHKVVFVYPLISGKNINARKRDQLNKFVKKGGTLLATNVLGAMYDDFGIEEAIAGRNRYKATLVEGSHKAFKQFKAAEEKRINFGRKNQNAGNIGTTGYRTGDARVMMRFDDGTSLLHCKKSGKGMAYAFGMDLGEFFSRCHNSRGFDAEAHYVNSYEPSMDIIMRTIESIYRSDCPFAVTLGTVPYGKAFTMCLTHDIDYTRSIVNAVEYSKVEKERGVKATYYMQTKYIKDWNDDIFYNKEGVHCVAKVIENGMEIGSHTVSHSHEFSKFPLGSGREAYPSYRPFVEGEFKARNGTVLGELRVSKYLLEHFNPGLQVVSFRAGHLSNPFQLPEALLSTHYRNSSNVTANSALTHLPFQLNYNRNFSNELPIFEYPVTIEDEEIKNYDLKYKATVDVCNKVSAYGGFVCVLLHTDMLGPKLDYEKKLIDAYAKKAWFSTIRDFDAWWTARNQVTLSVKRAGDIISLTINAPEAIKGLVIDLPRAWEDVSEVNCDYEVRDGKLRLGEIKGRITFDFMD